MEVLGVLRCGGITVSSTNATLEKKPLKSFDPCPQQKRSPYVLHDSYLLERQRVEAGRPLAQWHAHTLSSFFPFSSRGRGAVLRSSIRMWMFSAYTMWQAPLLSEARTTSEQQLNIHTHPSLEKNKVFKMALVLLLWWHLLVCLLGGAADWNNWGIGQAHNSSAWNKQEIMYPFIHSRGGVGNTLLDNRHGNLYGGVGSSFLAAVINVPRQQGWSTSSSKAVFILNFRC